MGTKASRNYRFLWLRNTMISIAFSENGRCIMIDHPIIKLFEVHAELLDIGGSVEAIDDAIVQLAAWMDGLDLSEDDEALLCHIGAVLYREGLRRRMGMRP